jgi:ketosteroid isomerase-like protein
MSEENVEVAMAYAAAYNSGDFDETMRLVAPDVEAFPAASFLEGRPLHGREDYREWLEGLATAWVNVQWVIREVTAVEDGRVLVRGDWGGEGVASGMETASNVTAVVTIRDGLIARFEYYFDHDDALIAVGLKE